MSENEIKPVAWRYSNLDEEVGFTDDPKWAEAYPDSRAPLYDQQAIDRLTAERDALMAALIKARHALAWGSERLPELIPAYDDLLCVGKHPQERRG